MGQDDLKKMQDVLEMDPCVELHQVKCENWRESMMMAVGDNFGLAALVTAVVAAAIVYDVNSSCH